MKLPNGERADLGTKIEDCVLNPNHWREHKAPMFESTLGITLNNQEVLRKAILGAAVNSEQANAIGDNGHGMVYVLRFPLTRANRIAMILTVWGRPGTARSAWATHDPKFFSVYDAR